MIANNLYYSTNGRAPEVPFKEALLKGLAPDNGLYLPRNLPVITADDLNSFRGMDYPRLAASILNRFTHEDIGFDLLSGMCHDIYTFDVPVEKVVERKYILRLDRGPTASFKDFAALLMGRLMQHFLKLEKRHITILTATSGDTGSAVANAFYGLDNINVVILFPFDEVSEMQRKQMTTLKKNVRVYALDGKFDDCQRLVKEAFMDPALSDRNLSSANSINTGRLLPQSVYYFWSWLRCSSDNSDQAVFSVPSGNFGNLTGGILARKMGLPVKRFVISTNENDEVPVYFKTGNYNIISPSKKCISSAMNVGHPSNMARIVALYGGQMNEHGILTRLPNLGKMVSDMYGTAVSDELTRKTMEKVYRDYNVLLEPHGAVAWNGLMRYLDENVGDAEPQNLCISLETAHPAKFPDEVEAALGFRPGLPASLEEVRAKDEEYHFLDNNYEKLKEELLKNY